MKKPLLNSNSFLKRYSPVIIIFLSTIIISLGMWGYFLLSKEQEKDAFSVLYETILMFKMESYEAGAINWQLVIARYLAAILVSYGVYIIAIDHIKKGWSLLRILLFYKNHTIIAGLGLKGYLLAKDLKRNKEKVVVIESNPDSIYLQRIIKEGIIVFISDGLDKRCWLDAGLIKAKRFYLVMDSDDKNIETATFLSQFCSKRTEKNPLQGWVHVDNTNNLNILKDHLDIQFGTTNFDINVFNTTLLTAQRMWDLYPPHKSIKEEKPLGENIAILVSGSNEAAEAFIVENLILSHYADQKNIRLLWLVSDDIPLKKEIHQKYPFIHEFLDIEVIKQPDNHLYSEFSDIDCKQKLISDTDFGKLKCVYIFGDDDSEVLLRAKKIKQCFYNRKPKNFETDISEEEINTLLKEPPFVVCLPEKNTVVELLNYRNEFISNEEIVFQEENPDKTSVEDKFLKNFNIVFYRQFTDTYTKTHLIDDKEVNIVLAKIINYYYAIKYSFKDKLEKIFITNNITFDKETLSQIGKIISDELLNITLKSNDPIIEIEEIVLNRIINEFNIDKKYLEKLTVNYRWNMLTDRLEDSNIYAARHIPIKLLYRHNTNDEIEVIAPIEHKRWMAEKMVFLFKKGVLPRQKPLKNIIKEDLKINNLIIPFDMLPTNEKHKDYDLFYILDLMEQITERLNNA